MPYRDDQTTLSYIIAKYYIDWDELLLLDFSSTSNNKYFEWRAHKSNRVINVKNSNTYCFDKEQKLGGNYTDDTTVRPFLDIQ